MKRERSSAAHKRVQALVVGAASGAVVLGAAGGTVVAATSVNAQESGAPQVAIAQEAQVQVSSTGVADASLGTFSFDQNTITPNNVIASQFKVASATLCSATDEFIQVNPLEWRLSVTGDVNEQFSASVDELANESSVKQTMTCTCGGNPADGRATITADVKGIPITYLLDRADAQAGVNTITFISDDGTQVAMPLSYVVGHHGVLSYEINGEDLSASVGGNNQLWLAGTSANYFVRNVFEIRVTREEQVPDLPGKGMQRPNSPNVGITGAQIDLLEK